MQRLITALLIGAVLTTGCNAEATPSDAELDKIALDGCEARMEPIFTRSGFADFKVVNVQRLEAGWNRGWAPQIDRVWFVQASATMVATSKPILQLLDWYCGRNGAKWAIGKEITDVETRILTNTTLLDNIARKENNQ